MSLTQVTANGLQHGLINSVGNSVPDNGFKRFAEKDLPKMEKKEVAKVRVASRLTEKVEALEELESEMVEELAVPAKAAKAGSAVAA